MASLSIHIDSNSLPIHSAVLYINESKIPINSTTQNNIRVLTGENTIRINDLGIRLLPTKLMVSEGEIKNIFIGLRKKPKTQENMIFSKKIWETIKSALDLDLQFYILEGL